MGADVDNDIVSSFKPNVAYYLVKYFNNVHKTWQILDFYYDVQVIGLRLKFDHTNAKAEVKGVTCFLGVFINHRFPDWMHVLRITDLFISGGNQELLCNIQNPPDWKYTITPCQKQRLALNFN